MKKYFLSFMMLTSQLYSAELPAFNTSYFQTMKNQADGDDAEAAMYYGCYLVSSVYDQDVGTVDGRETISKGMSYLIKAADLGLGEACYFLGMIYLDGEYGIVPDQGLSKSYFERAVEKNVGKAYVRLAQFYVLPGFTSDFPDIVVKLLEKSIAAGDLIGYGFYAALLRESKFLTPDLQRSFSFFKKVSDEGDSVVADSMVAVMYNNGEGCEKNLAEAEKYYKKALDKTPDDTKLQRCYAEVILVRNEDPVKVGDAQALLKEAADSGDSIAQKMLGLRLYCGLGFIVNKVEGKTYIMKAAAQGDEQAIEITTELGWRN